MNQGFSFYFKSEIGTGFRLLKGNGFSKRLALLTYFVMSFLGKLFFFTRPIFLMGDANLAVMIKETGDFSFEKIFQNVGDKKRYFKLLCATFIISFLLIAGVLLSMLPGIFTFIFLESFTQPLREVYITAICFACIPFDILALFYAVVVLITYSPIGYMINKNRDLDVGDLLYNAREIMCGRKRTSFSLNLVLSLINLAIYGLTFAAVTTVVMYAGSFGFIFAMIIAITMFILTLYLIQGFFVTCLTMNVELYKDVCLDHLVVVKNVAKDAEHVESVSKEENIPTNDINE